MDIKKLNPWNWFSRENDPRPQVPVRHDAQAAAASALVQLHEDLDRTVTNIVRSFGFPTAGLFETGIGSGFLRPHVDVVSGDQEYVISIEVPGVAEDDVKLELSPDGTLIVSGEKRQETENRNRDVHRIERSYGAFRRILSLPDDADLDGIDACFRNGVLTVICPRTSVTKENVRRIDIKKAA